MVSRACTLPYVDGQWTERTTKTAQRCILDSLQQDIDWWRHSACPDDHNVDTPDVESTLCRVRAQNRHTVFTNMILLRSHGGSLSALILVDPNDPRGPRRHWPGRTIGTLQQLAELQQSIRDGKLPPLPDFIALVNPHDQPEQLASSGWCGLLPILSNSRTRGVHRDLLMPDYSFASTMYLTNSLVANMSDQASVPQGWSTERTKTYRAGADVNWRDRRKTLFWRGGDTHPARKTYSDGLTLHRLHLPAGMRADAFLCDNHCATDQGLPPSGWCGNQALLSLPGHSFAVGFKYTMLCGSLVVRGAHGSRPCNATSCETAREEFEQWWQAGLRDEDHYVVSRQVDDLPAVLARAGQSAEAIGRRGADYAYHVLNPDFILRYWHELLSGYAGLHAWKTPLDVPASACERSPPRPPLPTASLNQLEQTCLKGPKGRCQLSDRFRLAAALTDFVPILAPDQIAAESRTKRGLDRVYSRHVHVLPGRFGGGEGVSAAARAAMNASGLVGSAQRAGKALADSNKA